MTDEVSGPGRQTRWCPAATGPTGSGPTGSVEAQPLGGLARCPRCPNGRLRRVGDAPPVRRWYGGRAHGVPYGRGRVRCEPPGDGPPGRPRGAAGAPAGAHQRPGQDKAGKSAVHPPAGRGRLRPGRPNCLVDRRGELRRDAQRVQHVAGVGGHRGYRRHRRAGRRGRAGASFAGPDGGRPARGDDRRALRGTQPDVAGRACRGGRHGLHRGGGPGVLRPRRRGGRPVGSRCRRRGGAGRPGRARHPAPRGGAAVARP